MGCIDASARRIAAPRAVCERGLARLYSGDVYDTMRVHILPTISHGLGQHSGYEQLPLYLSANVRTVTARTTRNQIRLGKLYRRWMRWREPINYVHAAAELRYRLSAMRQADVHHILYGEMHERLWNRRERVPRNVIVTLHHPPAQWAQQNPNWRAQLRCLQSALLLYQSDIAEFEATSAKDACVLCRTEWIGIFSPRKT